MDGNHNSTNNQSKLAKIKSGYMFSKIDDFLPKEKNLPSICKYNKVLLKKTDVSVFLKRCCWLDYCEKMLLDSSSSGGDLIFELSETVLSKDIMRMEKNLQDKSEDEKQKFHFDDTTGKIDEVFKLVLKAYLLQDVLFDLFSIDESDIRKLDFVENGWRDWNQNSTDLLKEVITSIVTNKEKQDKRLEQFNEVITQPNKKITIKTFDEHNEQNKNFAPEEKRNLYYQISHVNCFSKIQGDINRQRETFTNSINAAQAELSDFRQQSQNLQNSLNREQARVRHSINEESNSKIQLKKSYKCKELCLRDLTKLPFKVKFVENQINENPRYDVEIENDNVDADDNGENVAGGQQNLNDIDLENMSLEALRKRKKELLKERVDCIEELESKYNFGLEQAIGLNQYIEQDLSRYDEKTQKQIKDIVTLSLDKCITALRINIVSNRISKLKAQQNCSEIQNQLRDFDTQNNPRISELEKIIQTNKSKQELLDNVWNRFDGVDSNDFALFKSGLISKTTDLFGLNSTYLNEREMLWLYDYISNHYKYQFGHFSACFDDGIFEYCEHIKNKYCNSETQTQEEKKLIINQLGIVIAKHPKVNFDNDKVTKMLERVFFVDGDIEKCKKPYDDMFTSLKVILVCFAITVVLLGLWCILGYVLSIPLIGPNWLSQIFLFLSSISTLESLGFIGCLVCILSLHFPEIRKYQSYKKSFAQRQKNFYNYANMPQYRTFFDFKKDVEKQKKLLDLRMKYGEKVPAPTEEVKKNENNLNNHKEKDDKEINNNNLGNNNKGNNGNNNENKLEAKPEENKDEANGEARKEEQNENEYEKWFKRNNTDAPNSLDKCKAIDIEEQNELASTRNNMKYDDWFKKNAEYGTNQNNINVEEPKKEENNLKLEEQQG